MAKLGWICRVSAKLESLETCQVVGRRWQLCAIWTSKTICGSLDFYFRKHITDWNFSIIFTYNLKR